MSKNENTSVIRLSKDASSSLSTMLNELLKIDENLKINYSKLASYILTDFKKRSFERLKPKLAFEHQDKKKHLKGKIESLDSKELETIIKFLGKLAKPTTSTSELVAKE